MAKDCVIMSSWIPSIDRIQPYVDVLVKYYSDCDIYVGVNPSPHAELWLQKLKDTGLNIIGGITPEHLVVKQHTSAVQTALKLYKESDVEYDLVHFIHTKGISYNKQEVENPAFRDYYLGYAKQIQKIRNFMEERPNYGGWGDYGIIQYQWFRRETPQKNPKYPSGIWNEMADSENSTNIVHEYFDWYRFYPFKYTPIRTQWMTGFYTIRHHLLRNFIDNCTEDFLTKNFITELGFDIYLFETHIAQVVCRQGYIRYIDNIWVNNRHDPNAKKIEKNLIKLWVNENELNINVDKEYA